MKISAILSAFAMLFCLPLQGTEPHKIEPSIFDKMEHSARRKTGLYKLSPIEELALESWITTGRAEIQSEIAAITGETPLLFTMKNGDVYQVASRFTKRAKSWNVGDTVYIALSRKPIWFRMEHAKKSHLIGVKKVCPTTSPNP